MTCLARAHAVRCHVLGLSFYHIHALRLRHQNPLAPTSSSSNDEGSGDETGECSDQGRRWWQERRGADERNTPSQLETKERPAKGPIAQSWLTPLTHTHTHINAHALTSSSFIYPLLRFSLFFFGTPQSFLQPPWPFPLSVLLTFSHLLMCVLHPPCLWMYSQYRKDCNLKARPIPKSPRSTPILFVISLGNALMPSTSSAVYARMMWFPPAEAAVMKAGCYKSI